ncbi:MAG: hypothetical protein KDD55_11700 [Bdellovibrionales bacterium]|nr:hypothetical protein [Bdellovibrionales bacterium]
MSGNAKGEAAKSWLVSFGDLLTLLLCLFLFQFSNSNIKEEQEGPKDGVTHSNNMEDLSEGISEYGTHERGTLLAQLEDGTPVVESVFVEDEFALQDYTLNEEGRGRLKNVVIPEGYGLQRISLVTFSCEESSPEALRWLQATGRALSIQRQLIDDGYERAQIAVQVLGPHCFSKRYPESKEGMAALVRFSLKAMT